MAVQTTPATTAGQIARARPAAGLWSDAFGRLKKNKLALIGLFLVVALFVIAIVGPQFAPYSYSEQDTRAVLEGRGGPLPAGHPTHILGTDSLGRDLLSRMLDGARISMSVAIVVQLVVLGIGVPMGAIAGWLGGRWDTYLMRFTDVVYSFPDLLFIILLSVALRETPFGKALDGLLLVYVAIGLTAWVTVARLVRGQILSLKETEFVEAARAIGVSDRKILTRHLLPNGISPVIVAVTLGIPGAILAEATLAFIGIGVQDPRASWGSLIAQGEDYIRSAPHLVLFPAIAIAVALMSFTFLGDGLRDALDPKLKGKQ